MSIYQSAIDDSYRCIIPSQTDDKCQTKLDLRKCSLLEDDIIRALDLLFGSPT